MKDIRLYTDALGYFSLHDSAQDIIDKFVDRDNIKIDNQDKLTIIRDKTNSDNSTNAIVAFVTENNGKDIQIIDFCMSEVTKICIDKKEYKFSEFKEKFANQQNTVAFCDKLNKYINPFEVNKSCDSIYSDNDMECYMNCPRCGELKHNILLDKHNILVTCWGGSDNTMVSIERTKGICEK